VPTWSDPPTFPSLTLPEAPTMPAPVLEVPRAKIPSYKPLVVPPSDLRPPPGVRGENEDKSPDKSTPKAKEVQMVDVPFTDIEIPMPSTEIMTAAGTTAVISVAATLTATSVFKYLVMVMKPVLKQAWSKLTKKKKKKNPS
tara:strand:- start:263 stop:685 length:423 start_codon:yes stop_codon:yes gene_type:complete